MGFHICEYCQSDTSSGDVMLTFTNGHKWEMPDMILHYIAVHQYRPPVPFIKDVMEGEIIDYSRAQTKSVPERVGYLSGDFPTGSVQDGFFARLWVLLQRAAQQGGRRGTRGV